MLAVDFKSSEESIISPVKVELDIQEGTSHAEEEGVHDVSDILNSLGPAKSGKVYMKTRQEFKAKTEEPKEDNYLQYLDYLRRTKNMKASMLWTKYSILNNHSQLHFRVRLQVWPRIKTLLKSYESNYTRKKAQVFTKQEIDQLMGQDLPGLFCTVFE